MEDITIGFFVGFVVCIIIVAFTYTPFDHLFLGKAKTGSYCIERNVSDLKLAKCYEIKELK